MSIVCTICQDLLTESPQALPDDEELYVIAVKCGHVFHRSCIEEWFMKNGGTSSNGSCPCCKVHVSVEESLIIYLSGDEDSSDIAAKLKMAKALEAENGHLKEELSQINMLLEETGCQLENERVEREILKFEYTKQEKMIEDLRNELKAITEKEEDAKKFVDQSQNEKEAMNEELKALKVTFDTEKAEFNAAIQELRNQARPAAEILDKSCQTDCRDAAILQARLVSYKSCMLHMESEVRLLEEEYDKVSNLQPIPQEFECYIHEQNELAEKNKSEQPYTDVSDESIEQDDSGDSMSMEG